MAKKRMFSLDVVDTDAFLDMPHSSQLLYFHLSMRADDDGFVANPKKIIRMLGNQDDDYKILIAKRFIIPFESGICVIKHWRIHNFIRLDRYKSTQYVKEMKMLMLDNKTKKYSLDKGDEVDVIPNGNQMEPQVRLGKVRLETSNDKSPSKKSNLKLAKCLVDILLEEKKLRKPDGDYQKANLFPAQTLIKDIQHDYKERTGKEPSEEIVKSEFRAILRNMDDFNYKNASSIIYITKHWGQIISKIK